MKCKICHREAVKEEYCKPHFRANKNIFDKFDLWKKATNISWDKYLIEIQKNSLTGEWAKDIIKYLIEEERKNVTKS